MRTIEGFVKMPSTANEIFIIIGWQRDRFGKEVG